ncbi:hypothetical protein A3A76_00795 [Candidatus Woesebacteria bacterium RIFCSPLOWO2_01_FULL_39_23]|uniref:Uncharacterized protein n=1 Tax=Candidatus Woesebacteria bacterium RIFCSPHIGHO2_01_FULL_40_22 TaxID=1802499 RepID=A0A1F7YHF1_9BACT|nr:MAG: hypothetical protein A2141_05440 [Candidatus Woesebacteria bacterium RBG_16_40_11]OGM26781.1 MAG: hypothetical protein A2628_04470 [Candidatus Woesebacteria bacterium RIFCSPHIGHO2_01_FULL_40_22]OGM35756.1 MAG: hypothetical protein A3E41_03825 [Candidatus Woesebacteria bacterium RIFCSPHIGHO2_12_FULL_38_9]OGM63077.1 MAG: hypothetical protein A3A76_00795 [Candidatus Woesebacteria bacterium RIFCSPLOWO2_01_FULL_39_23]
MGVETGFDHQKIERRREDMVEVVVVTPNGRKDIVESSKGWIHRELLDYLKFFMQVKGYKNSDPRITEDSSKLFDMSHKKRELGFSWTEIENAQVLGEIVAGSIKSKRNAEVIYREFHHSEPKID